MKIKKNILAGRKPTRMRIWRRRDRKMIIQMLSELQMKILLEDQAMNEDLRIELSSGIRDLVIAIDGNAGDGLYARNLIDNYFMRDGKIVNNGLRRRMDREFV